MGIFSRIQKIVKRDDIIKTEQEAREDLIKFNKDKIEEDISQRRGLATNSGLSIAERDYILSDSMIASGIQLYLADILSICDKNSCIITSEIEIKDKDSDTNKKLDKVKYVFKRIFSDQLTEAMAINLLNNGEIFLETSYSNLNKSFKVVETSYSRCTQLCFSDGVVATYVVSDMPIDSSGVNNYSYSINNQDKQKLLKPTEMVRVYIPTLVNSKVRIDIDTDIDTNTNQKEEQEENIFSNDIFKNNYLYYTNSQSLLKQIYPDWLNSKLLELAVYRDRIAKSRFIQLIALELGRTSRVTSDQIYDSVKDYFDKRSVIDLEKQTFKSVVGNEPFTDYKVYTTRNGVGQIKFDSSLNGNDANVSSLADLEYNQTKVFAGLGIPKQYLGADDNGSALSNGGSLFFMDEKYKKRVTSYVKRIANGYKDCIKNLLIQKENNDEFFSDWDFDIEFEIPESNEDVYRVKNTRVEYVDSLIDLVTKINEAKKTDGIDYSISNISGILQEDLSSLILKENESLDESESEEVSVDSDITT